LFRARPLEIVFKGGGTAEPVPEFFLHRATAASGGQNDAREKPGGRKPQGRAKSSTKRRARSDGGPEIGAGAQGYISRKRPGGRAGAGHARGHGETDMIRAAFSGLAGAWIARNVERGDIPEKFAIPLTLLATRIPTPLLLAGAIGYGFYRWNQDVRASAAKDVTPPAPARPSDRNRKSGSSRSRQKPKSAQAPADRG